MLSRVWDLLFPEKCVLCQKVLEKGEQALDITKKTCYSFSGNQKWNKLHRVPREDCPLAGRRWNKEIRLESGAYPVAVSAGVRCPRREPAIGKLRR